MGMSERKTGKYFIEGLSAKSNKRIFSKNFPSEKEAIEEAIKRQREGKIIQADIMFTKNIISDVPVWDLDTKGKVKRYNKEKREFEYWN